MTFLSRRRSFWRRKDVPWDRPPPSKTPISQKRKQPSSPKSGAARCRIGGGGRAGSRPSRRWGNAFGNGLEVGGWAARAPANRRFPHRVLTNGHGVRHPRARGGGGYGLVFDRIYRINRIEGGDGRNAEDAEITQKARREMGTAQIILHIHFFTRLD